MQVADFSGHLKTDIVGLQKVRDTRAIRGRRQDWAIPHPSFVFSRCNTFPAKPLTTTYTIMQLSEQNLIISDKNDINEQNNITCNLKS